MILQNNYDIVEFLKPLINFQFFQIVYLLNSKRKKLAKLYIQLEKVIISVKNYQNMIKKKLLSIINHFFRIPIIIITFICSTNDCQKSTVFIRNWSIFYINYTFLILRFLYVFKNLIKNIELKTYNLYGILTNSL